MSDRSRIVTCVLLHPGASAMRVARITGISINSASAALTELERAGELRRRPDGVSGNFLYYGVEDFKKHVDAFPRTEEATPISLAAAQLAQEQQTAALRTELDAIHALLGSVIARLT